MSDQTLIADYPWATQLIDEVLYYSATALSPTIADPHGREVLQAELARALSCGPGVLVFTSAFADDHIVDVVSAEFDDVIEELRGRDPRSALPPRDILTDALPRLAERNPSAFVSYYANDVLALAAEAWLGPGYQVSSTVSVVNPGAPAQGLHPSDQLSAVDAGLRFPHHVRELSRSLTLRVAVAHTDMPMDNGPPTVVPHSHKGEAADRPAVSVPLFKGDALFVNPALLHGAGANSTRAARRMANVLTITSGFGRVDGVDRELLSALLKGEWESSRVHPGGIANARAAAIPTRLDGP